MTASTTPRTSVRTSRRTVCALPCPAERRRLREAWGLSTGQLAAAFGITPATVRSWESGRTSPTGRRRVAYARFLLGLSLTQQLPDTGGRDGTRATERAFGRGPAVPEPRGSRSPAVPVSPPHAPEPVRHATPAAGRAAHTTPAAGQAAHTTPPAGRPAHTFPPRVRRSVDRVSAGRRRRLRYAVCAWGAWALALYVLFTMPAAG
ncbi:helix-turn-helix domain-containing protein [Streptomyces microflavus]|uniref:helix-turn-helix domain-containing protein n=1 Tax=Streptomyces microflavus TaxID=1919 RepID=UPI0036C30138